MKHFRWTISAVALLWLCLPVTSPAQRGLSDETAVRSVEGIVADGSGSPIEGAVVQLKNVKSLQIRSFVTQADGKYQFQGLSFSVDYELKATHGGKSSGAKTLSTFDSRKKATITLVVDSKK
jgi:hypothetical protein